jgi:hypothetical protein
LLDDGSDSPTNLDLKLSNPCRSDLRSNQLNCFVGTGEWTGDDRIAESFSEKPLEGANKLLIQDLLHLSLAVVYSY